jgi:hypothetical protein
MAVEKINGALAIAIVSSLGAGGFMFAETGQTWGTQD